MSDIDMNIDIQSGADLNIDIDASSNGNVNIEIETAPPGPPGEPGKPGAPGKDGVGIESIIQTVLGMGGGAKNEWLITLTDGRTETITIYNGENGNPGKPGFSPTIEVVEAYDTISLIITDVNGTKTVSIPLIPPSIDVPDNEFPGGGTTATTITINGEPPDENGNFVINTVSDVEIAQLSAALT